MTGTPITVLVLRPSPGNAATLARLNSVGLAGEALPLFTIQPVEWSLPDGDDIDALLLTSANAVRYAGGAHRELLASLPAWCVGAATAAAAWEAGLRVARVGDDGVAHLLAGVRAARLLWLSGAQVTAPPQRTDLIIDRCIVYRAVPAPIVPAMLARDAVVLVHSAAAGARLAALVPCPALIDVIAISDSVAAACGTGWRSLTWPSTPDDGAMVALARELCQKKG